VEELTMGLYGFVVSQLCRTKSVSSDLPCCRDSTYHVANNRELAVRTLESLHVDKRRNLVAQVYAVDKTIVEEVSMRRGDPSKEQGDIHIRLHDLSEGSTLCCLSHIPAQDILASRFDAGINGSSDVIVST
jgi:hypothetical protein